MFWFFFRITLDWLKLGTTHQQVSELLARLSDCFPTPLKSQRATRVSLAKVKVAAARVKCSRFLAAVISLGSRLMGLLRDKRAESLGLPGTMNEKTFG